jgi:hypothetical protein
MSNPEVEVHNFKQQGGESFKDAWYRISNAHHRCTKKHSTMILYRNFYVGIYSWNRYILDTLTGGNFSFQYFFFYLSLGSYYYCNDLSLSFLFCFCAKKNL